MSDDKLKFASFEEFWPFYLSEHLHPTNRTWHFAGITLGIIISAVLLITGFWYLSPLGFVPGYLFAWVGHYGYEKNTPASFGYPWFSLLGDLNVYWRTLTGRIDRDYERLNVEIQRFADETRRRKAAQAAVKTKTA